jgi:hypothetical protein
MAIVARCVGQGPSRGTTPDSGPLDFAVKRTYGIPYDVEIKLNQMKKAILAVRKRRPRGSESLPVVTTRLTPETYALAQQKADELKLTKSELLRQIVEKALKR